MQRTIEQRARGWRPGALLGLALLALAACSGGSELPDFPEYTPAERFLAMQARQQAYQPPQPQPYPYTARNQHILVQIQRNQEAARAELAHRARLRQAGNQAALVPRIEDFDALRLRIARDELLEALNEQERSGNLGAAYARAARELARFQERLERLRADQAARERQRAEDEVGYRAPKLEEWEALRLRVARDQALDVLQERERLENTNRANERSNNSIAAYEARLERLSREKEARERERARLAGEARQQRALELQARLQQMAPLPPSPPGGNQ